MPNELIAIIAIIIIIGLAITYIIKQKKNGVKCIGCPSSKTCKIKEITNDLKEAREHCCKCSINK